MSRTRLANKNKGKSLPPTSRPEQCNICNANHSGGVNVKCMVAESVALAKYLHNHKLPVSVLNIEYPCPSLVKSHMDLMRQAEQPLDQSIDTHDDIEPNVASTSGTSRQVTDSVRQVNHTQINVDHQTPVSASNTMSIPTTCTTNVDMSNIAVSVAPSALITQAGPSNNTDAVNNLNVTYMSTDTPMPYTPHTQATNVNNVTGRSNRGTTNVLTDTPSEPRDQGHQMQSILKSSHHNSGIQGAFNCDVNVVNVNTQPLTHFWN